MQMLLLDCVWTAHAGNDILCIVDAKIRDDQLNRQIERTLLLGLLCCHPDPACRYSSFFTTRAAFSKPKHLNLS